MIVILDSNVLLSSIISQKGAPALIYDAMVAGKFELLTSNIQLEEIRRASRYPKFSGMLKPHKVGSLINYLRKSTLLQEETSSTELNDPDDVFLLALAEKGNADFLVTGDKRAGLLQQKSVGRTRIVTPKEFCDLIGI